MLNVDAENLQHCAVSRAQSYVTLGEPLITSGVLHRTLANPKLLLQPSYFRRMQTQGLVKLLLNIMIVTL
jgi:hypothetical protein